MMKLFTGAESGNSWKVRILLEQLEVPYEKVYVDLLTWEHKTMEYMAPSVATPRASIGPIRKAPS
jgi:glutathione S-transferase